MQSLFDYWSNWHVDMAYETQINFMLLYVA